MSQPTFNQTTHGEYCTPVQNHSGILTINNDNRPRGGDLFSFGGNIGAIGSVGGSDVRSTIYAGAGAGTPAKNPTPTGI